MLLSFETENKPVTALYLWRVLKKAGINADLVSVYRNLELFLRLNIIQKTQFEDRIDRYEMASDKHHHHLVCTKCGTLEDASFDEGFLENIGHQSNFKVEKHTLEFFGTCANCQI